MKYYLLNIEAIKYFGKIGEFKDYLYKALDLWK